MEIKVYGINIDTDDFSLTTNFNPCFSNFDEESFLKESKKQGLVWTLSEFQKQFNFGTIATESLFILIKTV